MVKKLVAAMVVCLLVFPAYEAAAGKKKKPKPYKSEQVTLGIPHPLGYSASGNSVNSITAKEFEQTCATPTTQGVDAHIFEVPKEYQKIVAEIKAIAAPATPVPYDIDLYFYDASCTHTIASNSSDTSVPEVGVIPKGTAWVMLHTYTGEPNMSAHIELKAR